VGEADKAMDSLVLNNAGQINWGGGRWLADYEGGYTGVQLTNLATGLIDIQTDAQFTAANYQYGNSFLLHNAGTIRKSAGPGVTTFTSGVICTNTGLVDLASGTIVFEGGLDNQGEIRGWGRLAPLGWRPDGFWLRLSGVRNATYELQFSTDLTRWEFLLTTNAPSDRFDLLDPTTDPGPKRFYRARAKP
jgi:hypothetical protein